MAETAKTSCPFCAIAAGADLSVEVIYEADSLLAFFPDAPATPGHTLIIPRRHVADLWAADPDLSSQLTAAAIHVGRAIEATLRPEGINLITSKGEAAEQSVFHLHFHLVPRWGDDALEIWPPKQPTDRAVRQDLATEIRAALARSTRR